MKRNYLLFIVCTLLISQCTFLEKETLFRKIPASHSGLDFMNLITTSDSVNGVTFEYIYNGGGLAIGDVNNDGLKDIFFAGNMVSSELYLNLGGLKFKKITQEAGVNTNLWCTGVSMVDINNDGLNDIYVCVAGYDNTKTRENIFFINQGVDENGMPHFENRSMEMGLNDNGYSTMGVFFDYDKDNDLDVFVLTNSMDGAVRSSLRPISKNGDRRNTDRLFRNEGDGKFTNVSNGAGILFEGYGLGVAVCDINQDGWADLYCSNDFISNDLLYINNQDGTFAEKSGEYFKHFSINGMGMDVADYNNDGLLDVLVLDMLPSDNKRQKIMRTMDKITFKNSQEAGYHPQFLRNTLQLNRGIFQNGIPQFSEIGYLADVYQTDWSWAPLLVDLDNDGWKDLLITNGFGQDVTNMDFIDYITKTSQYGTKEANRELYIKAMDELPDVKLANFVFKNNGDLTFEDKSMEWGLDHLSLSNGTAYADFDNDGDMDLIFSNIDQEVFLYENTLNSKMKKNNSTFFLKIKFDQSVKDAYRMGLKVWIYQKENQQFMEYYPYKGYKSTVDQDIHFGLGNNNMIDSIIFQWSDGQINKMDHLKGDTILILSKNFANNIKVKTPENFRDNDTNIRFTNVTDNLNLNYKHVASTSIYNDFSVTPTLLHSLSNYGPSISIGDINNDGKEDIYIGGGAQKPPTIFLQNLKSGFSKSKILLDSTFHDMGSLFFDADQDGDIDLYVVSGGYRWPEGHNNYQDRLYINDGFGNFSFSKSSLPEITSSGSCVVAGDYDKDGDMDLFVGGRVEGQSYPFAPKSYLLQNDNGVFIDKSDLLDGKEGRLGMVTSAIWTDVNDDLELDLIIVGEWMPVTILINKDGKFSNRTAEYGLDKSTGWWNSINGADIDNDGDTDYVLGNYGLNSFYKASVGKPMEILTNDFDNNGTIDPIITKFINEESYITHPFKILTDQIPAMKYRFETYEAYGDATLKMSFTAEELKDAYRLTCEIMESVVIENINGTSFKIHPLPIDVQFSPVFGVLFQDLNADSKKDLILVGNSMKEEPFSGFYDASYGNVLLNMGGFDWKSIEPSHSNFVADGDKKALAKIMVNDRPVYVASENDGFLNAYSIDPSEDFVTIIFHQNDWYFTYEFDGEKIKEELYHGSGFLSSSSRLVQIPREILEIEIYTFSGSMRKMDLDAYAKIPNISYLDIEHDSDLIKVR